MGKRWFRLSGWVLVWITGCCLWWWGGNPSATAAGDQWTIPEMPPTLINPSFECTEGFTLTKNALEEDIWIPTGWTPIYVMGTPRLLSSRMSRYQNVCDPNGGEVSKMHGHDAWYIRSQDIATPPLPGKPFDLILYQRVPARVGGEYSLSAWLTSECGDDKNGPNPCPEGQYIAKSVGIDPYGGTDHTSPEIQWSDENREDRFWRNVQTSARALSTHITIYARVRSPFQFHNNKGFVDAFSLVRAPLSAMNPLSPTVAGTDTIEISWVGQQSVDIAAIPGGNYDLLFDVQTRPLPAGDWRDIVTGVVENSTLFQAPCLNTSYEFRVRARAEQPENETGAFPNHRYPGVWSKPQTVFFAAQPTQPVTPTQVISPTLFLPIAARTTSSEC